MPPLKTLLFDIVLCTLWTCISASTGSIAQKPLSTKENGPFDAQFEKLANETLKRWTVPGLAIAVVDGGETWAEGYGIATFPSILVEPSTLFPVASTTKAFTASAMSFLVDDNGKYPHVQWDTPICDLIRDDFVLEDEYATTHITIEDALSHRSGMPRHDMSYASHYSGHNVTPKDVVRSLRFLPLTAEPRTKFQYSNVMYVVISYIIESLTGFSLGEVIRTQILDPLDMKSTYFSKASASEAPEHLAQGYYHHNGSFHAVPYMDPSQVFGAGFIFSNVLDYAKWIRALLDLSPPISKTSHAALRRGRSLYSGIGDGAPHTGPNAYALGWATGVYRGHEWIQHPGGLEAFGTNVVFFPALRYGLVAFANGAAFSNAANERLIWHLVDDKLGLPSEERFDWDEWNQEVWDKQQRGLADAKSTFYPSIPSPPLPLSLPLPAYTGTYTHPAYQNLTITLPGSPCASSSSSSLCSRLTSVPASSSLDPKLHIDRSEQTWKTAMDLEHISGDYFIAWVDSLTAPGSAFTEAYPVEFRLASDGSIAEVGLRMEEKMGERKIWFVRV